MSHVSLDAFQLLIAVYLFYVAAKGSGTLYNFPEIPESRKETARRSLRKLYAAAGCVALLDGCVSMLQNSMFTVEYNGNEMEITQNFTVSLFPFLSYRMLSVFSVICTVLFLLLLVCAVIVIRKKD